MASKDSFDMVWAYYAVVSIVSMVIVAITSVSLLQDIVLLLFPTLLDADVARDIAQNMLSPVPEIANRTEAELEMLARARLGVTMRDILDDAIALIVFGGLLIWHFPRMLGRKS